MGGVKLSISLPDELVRVVDRERGDVSRSLWIRRQIEAMGFRSTEQLDRDREQMAENAKAILRREQDRSPEPSPEIITTPEVKERYDSQREARGEVPITRPPKAERLARARGIVSQPRPIVPKRSK